MTTSVVILSEVRTRTKSKDLLSYMKKLKTFIKKFFLIDDTPHKIAAGASLGIFLGIIPGEGLLATLILASLFRFNRLSATAGALAFNMWATVVTLPISAGIGAFIFKTNSQELIDNFNSTYHLGLEYFFSKIIFLELVLPLIVGFLITAGIIALVFYSLIYFLLKYKKVSFR
ncbi:MAG: hypothetical protein US30_C0001G0057 [Candidatus Moranbacteria bacterium GW2011_GWF2_36_839]|nr:MAG: hypothetical protein US27_C0001G0057 [Candidatus Moranbacteria bacterium GW2011_GWF1_36_78]KKQ17723.1 MAG: hypothetical protein US30_C0001G0057 [Candidatus Moranbacteria bacterium GW2011_GWF2_36_839]HAT73425.1 hypothetical protein [Candidatus Moranbacteria bacterium]HBY10788.1 hypothetical protein [Candidatus Moranbacteria bacterium]